MDGVSFDIQRGETLGLVGESGCGKTTLGNACCSCTAPPARLYSKERICARLTDKKLRTLRQKMQMIFQDPLIRWTRVYSGRYHRRADAIIHGVQSGEYRENESRN